MVWRSVWIRMLRLILGLRLLLRLGILGLIMFVCMLIYSLLLRSVLLLSRRRWRRNISRLLWWRLRLFVNHIIFNRSIVVILQLGPSGYWRSSVLLYSSLDFLLRTGLVNRSHIAEFSLQKFEQIEALGTHHEKCNKYDSQVFSFKRHLVSLHPFPLLPC